eukprot:GHVR01040798.1.p1 GENE.GHVR01040798.1~~GHVR01040798.1.p1  ORF type:complete len:139 (+),score=15.52 GHVR01040798.1:98-514(+)
MLQLTRIEPLSAAPMGPQFSAAEILAMQKAVVNLAERWALTNDQASTLLGGISTRTFGRWKKGDFGDAGPDLAARLSNLLGIHKALRLLFKDKHRAYGWIKRPNTYFDGSTALDIMLRGNLTDIMRVRRLLDSMRAAW